MSRSDNDRLADILGAAGKVAALVACGRDAFDDDWTLRDAAVRQIEVIADAPPKMSPELLARFPDLPIQDIAGMRVVLAHTYWKTDSDIVWDTMTGSVPELVEVIGGEYRPPPDGRSPLDDDFDVSRYLHAIEVPPQGMCGKPTRGGRSV